MTTESRPGKERAFTWELSPEQDSWEARAFHRSVFRRLTKKAAALAQSLGSPEHAQRLEAVAQAPDEVRVAPEHAWVVFQDVLGRQEGRTPAEKLAYAERLVAEARAAGASAAPASIGTSVHEHRPYWAEESLVRISGLVLADDKRPVDMVLGNDFAAEASVRLALAKECLDRVWPQAGLNVERLVREMVWIRSAHYWSGSDVCAFGAIFVNPRPFWSVPYFYETLLHEGGHLGLMVKETMDPLILNADEPGAAPLRAGQRPLKGVMHATFALIRMVHGHGRYLSSGEALPDKDDSRKLYAQHSGNLSRALETLGDCARFTPAGQRLFDSIAQGFSELSRAMAS